MDVLVLTTDLIVTSLVGSAARRQGKSLVTAGSAAALLAHLNPREAVISPAGDRLVLIDLSTSGLDVRALVTSLRELADPVRVIAFGPHVHEQRLAEARDAGCDRVVSRGQFQSQVDALVAGE